MSANRKICIRNKWMHEGWIHCKMFYNWSSC